MQIQGKLLFAILVISGITSFKSARSQTGEILNSYIKHGIEDNLILKQKELNLEKSIRAFQEAKGLFYPKIGIEAQYYLAEGGRSIDMPMGSLLNPVYSSLNEILQSMGASGEFPQVADERIQFLPSDYHDTRIRIIMPLINAEIYFNRKIKKEMLTVSQAEVNVFKRELIKEIKTAYFHYLQAIKVIEAYKSAMTLVKEAWRVNVKLQENHMAGPEKLLRIEAEQSLVMALLTKAENDMQTAASYFNFLLNKPLHSIVEVDSLLFQEKVPVQSEEIIYRVGQREEIIQLNSTLQSTEYYYRMEKLCFFPVVSNITDLGFQGNSYAFSRDQQYVMNTINLSWSLFNGFQSRNKAEQIKIELESIQNKLSEAEEQIEFQCRVAEGNFESSIKSKEANKSSLASLDEYFKVVLSQYSVGQKSLLDLLDARNQLTEAQLGYYISHLEVYIRQAELERVKASIDLNLFND